MSKGKGARRVLRLLCPGRLAEMMAAMTMQNMTNKWRGGGDWLRAAPFQRRPSKCRGKKKGRRKGRRPEADGADDADVWCSGRW